MTPTVNPSRAVDPFALMILLVRRRWDHLRMPIMSHAETYAVALHIGALCGVHQHSCARGAVDDTLLSTLHLVRFDVIDTLQSDARLRGTVLPGLILPNVGQSH